MSGLIVEDCTRLLLEILAKDRDYRAVLSKANLRASHLCNFVEEVEKVIPVPLLELILQILWLRHAIHVVYGGRDLHPLTTEELSLVEDIMSGKFIFPSAKSTLR